jgi:hypothetical protein
VAGLMITYNATGAVSHRAAQCAPPKLARSPVIDKWNIVFIVQGPLPPSAAASRGSTGFGTSTVSNLSTQETRNHHRRPEAISQILWASSSGIGTTALFSMRCVGNSEYWIGLESFSNSRSLIHRARSPQNLSAG